MWLVERYYLYQNSEFKTGEVVRGGESIIMPQYYSYIKLAYLLYVFCLFNKFGIYICFQY